MARHTRFLLIAAAAALTLSCAAAALAASPQKGKPYTLRYAASSPVTSPPTIMDVRISRGLRVDGKEFPSCSPSDIQEKGAAACPKGSRVGSGSATLAVGTPGHTQKVSDTIAFFNGPGRTLIADFTGTVAGTIVVKVKPDSGVYGQKLRFNFPPSFQHPVAGLNASLSEFSMKLGATKTVTVEKHKQKLNFVAYVGCPSSGVLTFGLHLEYSTDPALNSSSTMPCPKSAS